MGQTRTQAQKLAESLRSLPSARAGLSNNLAMVSYPRAEIIGFREKSNAIPLIAMTLEVGRGKAAQR
jgi:hypothetical protein